MIKVHLDTDIGGDPDDLCALTMLLNLPDVEITGITTVSEKEGKRVGFVKYVLNLVNRNDIPVKAGAEVKDGYFSSNCGLPSESDYWPEPIISSPNQIDEALKLLKQSIESGSTIIGIGPYTNLFLLDKKYPSILKQAKIFLMGGYIYPVREGYPNWDNDTDWNIQVDVNSAQYVLEHANPTIIPLTVTVETALRRSYLPSLRESSKLGQIIATQAEVLNAEYHNDEKIGQVYSKVPDDILNFQHDPLACAIALGWNEGVEIQEIPLKFEIKDKSLHEVMDQQNGKPTQVVTKVNGDKFNEYWLKVLTNKKYLWKSYKRTPVIKQSYN